MADSTTLLLQKLQNGEITLEDCQKELRTKTSNKEVTYKISPKGCISFYGLRRMPISLYIEELEAILSEILEPLDSIQGQVKYNQSFQSFLETNRDKISRASQAK